jgi:hypothetical protein
VIFKELTMAAAKLIFTMEASGGFSAKPSIDFIRDYQLSRLHQRRSYWSNELSLVVDTAFTHMTRLTITEDPGEEFTVRGHNMVTEGARGT